jgi:hypothetical protein
MGGNIMSKKGWTVWVGGTEVTDYLVSKQVAEQTRNEWIEKGYNDCKIEEVTL